MAGSGEGGDSHTNFLKKATFKVSLSVERIHQL